MATSNLPQREPDEKDDSVVSFFTFPVHLSHWDRPLSAAKVPNYSISTFSFSLLSSLRSHTLFTQYLKHIKAFFSYDLYILIKPLIWALSRNSQEKHALLEEGNLSLRCRVEGKCFLHLSPLTTKGTEKSSLD